MRTELRMVVSSLLGIVVFGLLLFLPAGTFGYWQAWVFMATFTASTVGPTIYLYVHDRAALERRTKVGQESRPMQRAAIALLLVLFPALLVFGAYDHRFGWSPVPMAVSLIGDALVAIGMVLAMVVVVQNRYAAANVTVEDGQKVTTTGLYGMVRHPMYSAASIMIAGIPLALGSWWGLGFVIPVVLVFVLRILDEEKMLVQELAGYHEYMQRTRFRMVPYAW